MGIELKDFTALPLSPRVRMALDANAEAYGTGPMDVLVSVLEKWAKQEFAFAKALTEVQAGLDSVASRSEPTEKMLERQLAESLLDSGFDARTQVRTPHGDADVVIYVSNRPCAVIELKRVLRSQRDASHACAQATAYAESLECAVAVVCAPTVPATLMGGRLKAQVCAISDVAGYLRDVLPIHSVERVA